jgi:hypothetical protein
LLLHDLGMTFLTNCEFAIFTNSSPLVDPFDRRMTVGFPLPTLDQEVRIRSFSLPSRVKSH